MILVVPAQSTLESEEAAFEALGEEGFFDLHGSTIVLLFEKGRIELRDEILEVWKSGEVRVRYGEYIGKTKTN